MEVTLTKDQLVLGLYLVLFLAISCVIFLFVIKEIIKKSIARKYEQRDQFRKKLIKEVFKVQEHERNRISAELHDDFGSRLSGLRMQLYGAGAEVDSDNVEDMGQTIRELILKTRDLSHNLGDHNLKQYGLKKSLMELINFNLKNNGYKVACHSDDFSDKSLTDSAKTHIYRIFQELIANSLKHAEPGSTVITCSLETFDDSTSKFTYRDVGSGSPVHQPTGFGLNNIDNRIRAMEGRHKLMFCPDSRFSIEFTV